MDPNAALDRLLEAAAKVRQGDLGEASELADAVEVLHEWLSRGGFLPARWERIAPIARLQRTIGAALELQRGATARLKAMLDASQGQPDVQSVYGAMVEQGSCLRTAFRAVGGSP